MPNKRNLPGPQDLALLNSALPTHVRIQSSLDVGGQGTVYKGKVHNLDSAIKIYSEGQIAKRIEREVEALGRLNCPSIVRLLWAGDIILNGVPRQAVATALVPGEPLSEVLLRKSLNPIEIKNLIRDVALAIGSMWQLRVVHRDIKPSNIIIRPDGSACVIDLGVARHLDRSALTAIGASWGTLGYLSPEQTRGVHQLTCKSDIFSLGIVALEAAKGRHPSNGDQLRLFAEKLHERLPPEAVRLPFANLLMRMLDPQPTKRPLPEAVAAETA